MAVRAMVSTVRQFSLIPTVKLKRILVIDHHAQIKRISRRVKKYQNQIQSRNLINNSNIDIDGDDERSFANIFGVPQIPEVVSSTSESDDEAEPEEYRFPYVDHAKS